MDLATAEAEDLHRPSEARVCVEMNILQEQPSRIWIGTKETGRWQEIEIENKPLYCITCNKLGHNQNQCNPDKAKRTLIHKQIVAPQQKNQHEWVPVNRTTRKSQEIKGPVELTTTTLTHTVDKGKEILVSKTVIEDIPRSSKNNSVEALGMIRAIRENLSPNKQNSQEILPQTKEQNTQSNPDGELLDNELAQQNENQVISSFMICPMVDNKIECNSLNGKRDDLEEHSQDIRDQIGMEIPDEKEREKKDDKEEELRSSSRVKVDRKTKTVQADSSENERATNSESEGSIDVVMETNEEKSTEILPKNTKREEPKQRKTEKICIKPQPKSDRKLRGKTPCTGTYVESSDD